MKRGRRYGLSAGQKADIWRRWKAGESLHEIGRAFSKDHGSIVFLLSQHGGIAPAFRRRSPRTLTLAEREDISRGMASTVATKVNVYFCDPQSPWQRGTNENTNGPLRQYFPRKTDLSGYSQADLDKVAPRLYQRPRKSLDFETPASELQACVASTS